MVIDARTRRPVLGEDKGDLSGPGIRPMALLEVHQILQAARRHGVPIFSQGGVVCAEDALEVHDRGGGHGRDRHRAVSRSASVRGDRVGSIPAAWLLLFTGERLTALQATAENPNSDWLAEFEAAARRPLALRWRYAFIHTYKPVLDDAGYRSFDTMEEYRCWCEDHLPEWLGYGCVHVSPG